MGKSIFLNKVSPNISGEISIGGSKSESNRLLVLNSLFGNPIQMQNLSDSEDTRLLRKALSNHSSEINIHHAGTAMRFLTAYFSIQDGKETILTGSERMKQRPIGILVDALCSLGAEIKYLEREGFPPLKIMGRKLEKSFVELNAGISSQFITALMLIAPKLPNGLKIQLDGKITSVPYLEMSLSMLRKSRIEAERIENLIEIPPVSEIPKQEWIIESDWSSASYFYSVAALSNQAEIKLSSFFEDSLQGDAEVRNIYRKYFGVETKFEGNKIILSKKNHPDFDLIELDLNTTPDIAQTIAATCAGLKIKCKLTGLETLKVKETDRLNALQNELQKLGAETSVTNDSLEIMRFSETIETPKIKTYSDHRMALSFAPLALIRDIEIENPEVVEKSYPNFWKDLSKIEFIKA